MKKYLKSDIRRFEGAIQHVRENLAENGHGPTAAIACAGLIYSDEVKNLMAYAEEIGAHDVVDAYASERAKWL